MSVATVQQQDSDCDWDDLVRGWEELDAPEGFKAEIIEGLITLSPPPSKRHSRIADVIQRELYPSLPEEWGIHQTVGVGIPTHGGIYVPDLLVAANSVVETPGNSVAGIEVELAVEITSPASLRHDRVAKHAGYAAAGVPLYLLVDRFDAAGPTVTLYGDPVGNAYRVFASVKFGEDLDLPEPFECTVRTGAFPAPASQ